MKSVRTAALVVLTIPALVAAAPPKSFAEWLPAETIAYLETDRPTPAELRKAIAYKCLQEPELRRVLDRMLAESGNFSEVAMPMGEASVRLQFDIREPGLFFNLHYRRGTSESTVRVRGRTAFALVGMRPGGKRGPIVPDLVAALEVESDPREAVEVLGKILASVAELNADVPNRPQQSWKHGDVDCRSADLGIVRLHYAQVGRRLVLATLRKRLTDVIDRSRGTAAKNSLAASDTYRHARRNAHGDGTITTLIALNTRSALKTLARIAPEQFTFIEMNMKTAGLGGLEGIVSTSRVDGAGVGGSTSVLLSGRRVGLSRFFEGGEPAKLDALGFAPKQTLYVAAGRFKGQGISRGLNEWFGLIYEQASVELRNALGVNLRTDLLERIGPEAAFIVSGNDGLVPDVGLVFESDNPKRLQKALLTMLGNVAWEGGTGVDKTRIGGVDAYVVKSFHPEFNELPIAPTFGIVDGHFVLALYPISFQRFVSTKRGERESVAANRDFATLRKRIPEGALSVSYLDIRRVFASAYATLVPLLQSMPQEGETTVYELPEAHVFTKHLYGRVGWRTADKNGMHWHSHASTDLGLAATGFIGGVSSVLFLMRNEQVQARGNPGGNPGGGVTIGDPDGTDETEDRTPELNVQRKRCVANVRRIRNQLRLYQRRKMEFPEKIEDLRGPHIRGRNLRIPGTDGELYTWYGPDGRRGILLHGAPNGPDAMICVLGTDFTMRRMSKQQLDAILNPAPENPAPENPAPGK
ncbi:MAG: hypothetical protein AAGD14_02130 [Planctomycetota bacterium]